MKTRNLLSTTTLTVAVNEKTAFIVYTQQFKLYYFQNILRNPELRKKWIRASNRQNKDKTEWKPSESSSV